MNQRLVQGNQSYSQSHSTSSHLPPPYQPEMPGAAAATAYGSQPAQPMVGYAASQTALAMDVENPHSQRSKYAPHPQFQGQAPGPSKQYDARTGRSSRGREETDERNRPHGSDSRGSRNRYQAQASGHHYQSRQGPASATSAMTANQHFTPPPGPSYGQRPMATPPPEVQPSFPPPAVTSESPPPSEQSQRRPAYLLHRDLVIGKGSYGQVCIASRGEAEGHSSGRSGKRKKFACKCVMLRNDPKYISKLQEEVNVLRELRGHDNVIRLYDVFCVDNELFIITELGRGGDLFHLLTTHPKHGVTESYAGKLTLTHRYHHLSLQPPSCFVPLSYLQPRLSLKCFQLWPSCTIVAFAIVTSSSRTGSLNPGRMSGVLSS